MIKYICKFCKKEFFGYPSEDRKYCSKECSDRVGRSKEQREKIRKTLKHKASQLPTIFKKGHRFYGDLNKSNYFKKGIHYSTATEFKKGDHMGANHPNWKNGIKVNRGHITLLRPTHPFCNSQGYVVRSRLIAEKVLGRYLTSKERIHHINDDPSDDRKENLYLFKTQGYHCVFHRQVNKGHISLLSLKSNFC
jgi:hypothetical protein